MNRFFLGFSFLFLSTIVWAQMKTITGKVLDSNGKPQSDVAVTVQGSTQTVYTNETGEFSIEAEPGQTVQISSFDDEQSSFVVGTQSFYDVKLQPISTPTKNEGSKEKEIEGVVVTALNISREKKALGYSVQAINGDDLNRTRETNPLNSLDGKVAGLQIVTNSGSLGGSSQVRLRGIRSLSQSNKPLIVVDGVPLIDDNINTTNTQRGAGGKDYGDTFGDINPDDIENISVLKGATAAALYGSRASNGAIMITTKKGKKGKTEIVLNSGVIFDKIYKMPRHQKLYGGGASPVFRTQNINGIDYNLVDYSVDESWGPRYNPNINVLHWNAFDPEFAEDYLVAKPWIYPKNDYKDYFKTGITYNNGISFTKSIDNTNLRVSYNNTKTSGITPNSELTKNALSMSMNSLLSENLKLDANITYNQTRGFNRPTIGYNNSVMQKMFQFGQTSLDYKDLKKYKLSNGNQRTWNRTAWNNGTAAYSDNPYWEAYENTSEDKRDRFYGSTGLTYNITKDLYATGKVMMDTYTFNTEERVAIGSQRLSEFKLEDRKYTELNYEGTIHYDKNLGDFSISAFAGVNRRDYKTTQIIGQTNGGLIIRDLYQLNNSLEAATVKNELFRKRTNSLFYMMSIGYDNFVYLETTGRNDWSSTLPTNNNSYFYPAVTTSFVITRYLKPNWLNFLKVRAGYSEVRNDTEPYRLINEYISYGRPAIEYGNTFLSNPIFWLNSTDKNPNLKPEKLASYEVGIEFQMLKNRIGGDITYYHTTTSDLITEVPLDGSQGFLRKLLNAGEMKSQGIEVSLNITPIKSSNFRWDFITNFSKADSKVTSLADGLESLELTRAPFRARVMAIVGKKYGQIYGTDFVYDANGNKVVGSNGLYLQTSSLVPLGSILPDFNMGFRNTFTYKNISLGIQLDWQKGGKYFSTTHMWGMASGILPETAANNVRETGIIVDGVKADGTPNDTRVNAINYFKHFSSGPAAQNVFDADYVKLRELSLSYSIPNKYLGNYIQGITVSAFARNLFTWGLDWRSMDPEVASYGSGNSSGIEGGSLPTTRTFGFNIQAKF